MLKHSLHQEVESIYLKKIYTRFIPNSMAPSHYTSPSNSEARDNERDRIASKEIFNHRET